MKRWLAIAAFVPFGALHAGQAAPLQAGDVLENGGGQQVRVLQCRAVVYGRECETVVWADGRATSNPAWWAEADLLKGDARVRAALGKPPRAAVASRAGRASPPATPAVRDAGRMRVPDGSYQCRMWMGGSYVTLARVRSAGGSLSPDLLAKVGATMTGVAATADGITISYTTARGYRESMDCARA